MNGYTALILDIKKSRSYSDQDRTSIQEYILEVIEKLNAVFDHTITRKVVFSAGDEVQGLFSSPEAAFLYFRLFYMLVSPVAVRAGIGVGEWNIRTNDASSTAQDGPVYHNARRALDDVNDPLGYSVLFYSGHADDVFINALLNTSFIIMSRHSEYQNELMLLSELLYPIDSGHMLNAKDLIPLVKLSQHKNTRTFFSDHKGGRNVQRYPFDTVSSWDLAVTPIDAREDTSSFYVTDGRKRGLTSELADLLNISRQSVEKSFHAANISAVRNAAIAILKFINRTREEA